mmetsp:Transcript_19898/g.43230  ORF Transcript_19898/g.43230 Transcript_19898/m.43230 type:complete len:174 (+) Transcript_19898:166-687(+)
MNFERSIDREPSRDFRSSTKLNSDFKWRADRTVVGALEVQTDPSLDLRAEMVLHDVTGREDELFAFLNIWKDLKLRNKFIKAYESLPPVTSCCGLLTVQDATIRSNAFLLNEGWVKHMNKSLLKKGFQISIFVWCWNNIAGKAETVIPMIRFHTLPIEKEKRYNLTKIDLSDD